MKSRFLGGGITLGKMQIVPRAALQERCWAKEAETSGSRNVFYESITKKIPKNQVHQPFPLPHLDEKPFQCRINLIEAKLWIFHRKVFQLDESGPGLIFISSHMELGSCSMSLSSGLEQVWVTFQGWDGSRGMFSGNQPIEHDCDS